MGVLLLYFTIQPVNWAPTLHVHCCSCAVLLSSLTFVIALSNSSGTRDASLVSSLSLSQEYSLSSRHHLIRVQYMLNHCTGGQHPKYVFIQNCYECHKQKLVNDHLLLEDHKIHSSNPCTPL